MRRWLLWWVLICLGISLYGQEPLNLVAPNVFIRGIPVEQGFRYTATLIKSADNAPLRNLSVEITLPSDAQLIEMLVPRQVQFDVIRRDRQNRLTLIWQISRIESTLNLDTFSFTLGQPLTSDLEFYAQFEDETGVLSVQNFLESPTLVTNTVQVVVNNAPIPAALTASLLGADFNPPVAYGDLWWCSLLQLDGVGAGQVLQVIVPLRRPIAPFTELVLFQQQADSSWLPLENKGIVSADGQYVVYDHPGGVVASGGGVEIQPAIISKEQLVIVDVPDTVLPTIAPVEVVSAPPIAPISDGSSNTVIINEATAIPPTQAPISDGSSNTILVGETASLATATNAKTEDGVIIVGANTGATSPTATLLPLLTDGSVRSIGGTALPTQGISDGTSNTILIGEATITTTAPLLTDGSVRFVGTALPTQGISDGTSNTILIGEATITTTAPLLTDSSVRFIGGTALPTQGISDGTSNTILIGEATITTTAPLLTDGSVRSIGGTAVPTQGISDGTSNTILIGEATITTTAPLLTDSSVRFIGGTALPTQGISDGTSNTILIGEATITTTAPLLTDGSVRFVGTALPTQGISDGTSNTILIGEATPTATSIKTGDGVIIVGANVTPTSSNLALVTPSGAKTDGITTIAQATTTPIPPTPTPFIAPTVRPPVIVAPSIVLNPPPQKVSLQAFGTVTVRVVLFTTSINTVQQCTVGGINCAVLNRKVGTRVK